MEVFLNIPLKNQRRISAAKAEAVGHNGIQGDVILAFPHDGNAFRAGVEVGDVGRDA